MLTQAYNFKIKRIPRGLNIITRKIKDFQRSSNNENNES